MNTLQGYRRGGKAIKIEKVIRYWVFEFQFPEEKKKALDELTAKYQMTYDEFFNAAITRLIEHPEEFATLGALREPDGEEIKLIREYPVFEGETEEEARNRVIREDSSR